MTTTPTDKEQELPQFHMTENGPRHRSMVTWSGVLADCGPMTVAHLSAQIAALDPSTRARVLEPYLAEVPHVLRPKLADCEAALTTARAEVAQKEADYQGAMELVRETATTRDTWRRVAEEKGAEVERLKAQLANTRELLKDAREPPGLLNYGMDSDE